MLRMIGQMEFIEKYMHLSKVTYIYFFFLRHEWETDIDLQKYQKISHICNKVGMLLYYEAKADIGSVMGNTHCSMSID